MANGDMEFEVYDHIPRSNDEGSVLIVKYRWPKTSPLSEYGGGMGAPAGWFKLVDPTPAQIEQYAYGKTIVVPCPVPKA